MQLLSGLYDEYVKSLKPSKRILCPPAEVLRPLPEVIEIVEAPADVEVTSKDFEPIASRFDQLLAEYYAKRRDDCALIMKQALDRAKLAHSYPKDTFTRTDLHPVDLVESVWNHPYTSSWDYPRMIGWPSLVSQLHIYTNRQYELRPGVCITMPLDPVYISPLAEFAAGLVAMVGLQPFTLSAVQMDERDDRFTCDCLTDEGRKIFTWRSAVGLLLFCLHKRFSSLPSRLHITSGPPLRSTTKTYMVVRTRCDWLARRKLRLQGNTMRNIGRQLNHGLATTAMSI